MPWKTRENRRRAAGSKGLRRVIVTQSVTGPAHHGLLLAGGATFRCVLGRAGLTRAKREGDGATPAGAWALVEFRRRPARFSRAGLRPPTKDIRSPERWCDDPGSFLYNRPLRSPSRFRCETLWRGDGCYDLVGVLDYNLKPAQRGRGSAIFLHIATEDFEPTAGCVALSARDMARVAPRLARCAVLVIG